MGSQVGARWGLATLTISTRKIWYNWTIPPNQFLGEIRNKKKIRHCGKKQIFFIPFWYRRLWATRAISRNLWFRSEKVLHLQILLDFDFFEARDRNYRYNLLLTLFFLSPFHRKRISVGWSDVFPFFSSGLLPISRKWIGQSREGEKLISDFVSNWSWVWKNTFELWHFWWHHGTMVSILPSKPSCPWFSSPSIPKIILGGKKCHCSWG